MRLLLVEDDSELASVVASGLTEQGMSVTLAATFAEGGRRARLGSFDTLILDVMLPGGSGFDLCRELRRDGLRVPILMLTARDAIDDRVTGLDVGADDYLTKPFAFRELLARIHALGRRGDRFVPEVVTIADLSVDLGAHRATRAGKSIDLTAKEFALLECFARRQGELLTRAEITSHVWDENHDPFTNVLEVLIRRLRRKIDDPFDPKLIHTIRGAGYRFGV